jgi:hypothetical protein
MTYLPLHRVQERPSVADRLALAAVREGLVSTVTGVCFVLLAAAAGVFSLWLAAGRLLHRLTA